MIVGAVYAGKRFKKHREAKKQKLLEERGQLPDLPDPSKELHETCRAENGEAGNEPQRSELAIVPTHSSSQRSIRTTSSSSSNTSLHRALENDPEFKRYMEEQRQVYLEKRAERGEPPSYHAAINSPLLHSATYRSHRNTVQSPNSASSRYSWEESSQASPATPHCSCHECVLRTPASCDTARGFQPVQEASITPIIPEMPAHDNAVSELPTSVPHELDGGLASDPKSASPVELLSELPGNLPAILPELRDNVPELPT